MAPRELIADISSRLIVNKAAMRTRHASVRAIIDALKSAVAQQGSAHESAYRRLNSSTPISMRHLPAFS